MFFTDILLFGRSNHITSPWKMWRVCTDGYHNSVIFVPFSFSKNEISIVPYLPNSCPDACSKFQDVRLIWQHRDIQLAQHWIFTVYGSPFEISNTAHNTSPLPLPHLLISVYSPRQSVWKWPLLILVLKFNNDSLIRDDSNHAPYSKCNTYMFLWNLIFCEITRCYFHQEFVLKFKNISESAGQLIPNCRIQ